MSFMPRGRVNCASDKILGFSVSELTFLRNVQCSTDNTRCLCVCRLQRGPGLCPPCSPSRRASLVFRGWILLLRRQLTLAVGALLFARYGNRKLLRPLV